MKTIKLFAAFTLCIVLTACNKQEKTNNTKLDSSISKIEVFDFHSTHRCMTCNAIETNTKFTLDTYFKKELSTETITFQVLNVDDEKNTKIAEKFEASGTALILNVINNGKETQVNLTDFAFLNGNDQDAFSKALKTKIETHLKTL